MSPRHTPASAHELARIELFSALPASRLAELAARMRREQVDAGTTAVREGDEADRFYVVLSGLLAVSQRTLGPRRLLRPGAVFGEVALAFDMPRTATVHALMPSTVASCDRATFDELVLPLLVDERGV